MKMKSLFTTLLFILLSTSCTTTKCKWSGYKGKQCLKRGDFSNAVVHLGKAVELDATACNNRKLLADAYLGAGDTEQSWYHSRQTVMHDRHDFEYMKSFMKAYTAMVKKNSLQEGVSTLSDVVNALGEPDFCCTAPRNGRHILTCVYGLIQIKFENDTLLSLDL